jgi:hypothetical protein
MKPLFNYDIALSTVIATFENRIRFQVTATSKETLEGGPIRHVGIGDTFNDAFAELEGKLVLEVLNGQRS